MKKLIKQNNWRDEAQNILFNSKMKLMLNDYYLQFEGIIASSNFVQ